MSKESQEGNVPMYLYVPPDLKERFKKAARKKGTTNSALAREALEKHLRTIERFG